MIQIIAVVLHILKNRILGRFCIFFVCFLFNRQGNCQINKLESAFKNKSIKQIDNYFDSYLTKYIKTDKINFSFADTVNLINWVIKYVHIDELNDNRLNLNKVVSNYYVVYKKIPDIQIAPKIIYNDSEYYEIVHRNLKIYLKDSLQISRFLDSSNRLTSFALREFSAYNTKEYLDIQKSAFKLNEKLINKALNGKIKILIYSLTIDSELNHFILRHFNSNKELNSRLNFINRRMQIYFNENSRNYTCLNSFYITDIIFDKNFKYVKITAKKDKESITTKIYEIQFPLKLEHRITISNIQF